MKLINSPESYFSDFISNLKGFAIFMMDRNGLITSWNRGCEVMKGYNEQEAIGQYYGILFPDDLKKGKLPQKELDETFNNGTYETEGWRRKKDGELFWAYIVITKVIDEGGNFAGYIKISQDQSEKKKFETELKEKNIELNNIIDEYRKINAELDNFVYTASHDLKAPLNNMEGLLSALQDEISQEAQARERVMSVMEMMKLSIGKFRSNIADLAMTARIDANKKGYTKQSFKEILEDVKFSLSDEISRTETIFHTSFSEPKIKDSRKNIRSILYNLISNAIKYRSMERRPEISIRTERIQDFTLLSITDNGQGIKEEDKKNVFSMYQRLHTNVPGTGMGMAIVAKIVDDSGGRIEIDSKPGTGSTFKIYLKDQEAI